jgi:hypothetical protein
MPRSKRPDSDDLPDVRDGLTRVERVILLELHKARAEFGDRHVPVPLLYGRVVESVNIGMREFQSILSRLAGGRRSGTGRGSTGSGETPDA